MPLSGAARQLPPQRGGAKPLRRDFSPSHASHVCPLLVEGAFGKSNPRPIRERQDAQKEYSDERKI